MPRTKKTSSKEETETADKSASTESEKKSSSENAAKKPSQKAEEVVVTKVVRPVRRVSFEQWAARKGVRESHKGGMMAFVKNPNIPRSFDEWDRIFKDY